MHSSSEHKKGFNLNLQPALAWIAILGLVIFSALCILVHAGGILRFAFPVCSFVIGVFLYWRYPLLYLGFTWWLWFLTPWVRRLVDYQSGFQDPSVVLLTPFLVTLITFATFVQHFPKFYHQGGLPFILSFTGVFYGLLVGLIKLSPTALVAPLLEWLTPIIFSFHLFVNWRDYPSYCRNIQRTFLWGVLLTGTYGVLQYLVAPEWDRFWMISTKSTAFGSAEPLGIRVFSTMNSPGPFAIVIMAGLLLLFNSKGPLQFPASGVSYLAFLLTQVRSAWLGWLVGLFTLLTSLKPSLQMRLIVTILVMALCVIPLATIEPFSEVISSRLETFSNTSDDVSYRARTEGYNDILNLALSEFMGKGLGYVIEHASFGSNDSGILTMFLSLGWFGTIFYLSGLILLFFSVFQGSEARFDPFVSAARAISLGVFVQIGLGTVMLELSGVVLWAFLGMSMAARKYYQHQRTAELGG